MIHTYRYTLGQWVWELPAGSIKPEQTPLEAAQEELREEVGGQSTDWQFLTRLSTINGIGNHYGHLFLARNVSLDTPHHEPAEIMTVHKFPLDEALDMARSGHMNDALSVLALLLAAPLLQED
jgi:ADP-ribose pyrophosphatase